MLDLIKLSESKMINLKIKEIISKSIFGLSSKYYFLSKGMLIFKPNTYKDIDISLIGV